MRRSVFRHDLRREAATERDGIRRHAARLALAEIDLTEFFRATSGDWLRLAASLHNAYRDKLPEAVTPEDLAQEMRAETVRLLPKWNPRKRSIGDYLVFNAVSKAKKWLNLQRNAEGRKGNAPSRLPVLASRLAAAGDEGRRPPSPFERASVQADQESRAHGAAAYRRLKRVFGGDVRAARFAEALGRIVDGDGTRRDWRIVSETVESIAESFEILSEEI